MDEELWKTYHAAEYAYCPRLFYFRRMEGIFAPHSDTGKRFTNHQFEENENTPRVNEPTTLQTVTLHSQELKLSAEIQLIEIKDRYVVPMEYCEGEVGVVPSEFSETDPKAITFASTDKGWLHDRIEIGLKALLLIEAGYEVTEGVLYHIEDDIALRIIIDDDLKAMALEALAGAKILSKSDTRPKPLLNDPRCEQCSLQPICLPDEVNFQQKEDLCEEDTPRKLWPPRDEGVHLIAQQEAIKIGVRGEELKVTDVKGNLVKNIPFVKIESLAVLGNVQVTTQALQALVGSDIPVAYLTQGGRLLAMIDPLDATGANIRRAQFKKLDDPAAALELAQAVINAKIQNQRTILLRNHKELSEGVKAEMADLAKAVFEAKSVDSVRGYEGRAAALYFKHFGEMFSGKPAEEFRQNGRERRPPPDPINSCLSLAYSMLASECVSALRIARLDPSVGALHVSRGGRPALALDLMEPFRPLIADSVVVACFNRNELDENFFSRSVNGCLLSDAGRKAFFKTLGQRMNTDIKHQVFEYRLSYRRMLFLHAQMIAAWLMGDLPKLEFLVTR